MIQWMYVYRLHTACIYTNFYYSLPLVENLDRPLLSYIRRNVDTYTYMYMCICTCTCTCMCMYIVHCTCTCTYMYVYVHCTLYMYMYMYMYVYVLVCSCVCTLYIYMYEEFHKEVFLMLATMLCDGRVQKIIVVI